MTKCDVDVIEIIQPDDWHLHLRDDEIMRAVLPFSAGVMGRAIIMPNLTPPIVNSTQAMRYRDRILAALSPEHRSFTPLMTLYLTDDTSAEDVASGIRNGLITAVKLYPRHATTNSAHGVSDIRLTYPILSVLEMLGAPLLVHGEVTDADVDIFDREALFIERVLIPLRKDFPALKIVMEHITTSQAVDYVKSQEQYLAATVTPQHMALNRNALLVGGIRPHNYCLPILKREEHRFAVAQAATSADARFFLGTDSAPHLKHTKESNCGCAGMFSAPVALGVYANCFEQMGRLENLEAFCSVNGPRFYGLPVNKQKVRLVKSGRPVPREICVEDVGEIVPMRNGETLQWEVLHEA